MSLINQMLKDLEQRGAGSTDAEKIMITRLEAVNTPQLDRAYAAKLSYSTPLMGVKKLSSALLKVAGLMVLMAGGTYLWVQSNTAQSQSANFSKNALPELHPQNAASISAAANLKPLGNTLVKSPTARDAKPLFEVELKHQAVSAQTFDQHTAKDVKVATLQTANLQLATYQPANFQTHDSTLTALLAKPDTQVKPTENVASANVVTPEKLTLAAKKNDVTNNNTTFSKSINPEQKSGNQYRQALTYLQQGRIAEAQESLSQALETNPANQEARQTLAGLLLDNKRNDEARALLAAGLSIAPEQSNFRMAIARLQVEAGDRSGALITLEQGANYSKNNADYQSFFAALLQRADRHEEAINHYNTALSLNSASGSALVGLGISLQAVGKLATAQEAFARAQSLTTLSPELAQFVDYQLKLINQHLHISATQ